MKFLKLTVVRCLNGFSDRTVERHLLAYYTKTYYI